MQVSVRLPRDAGERLQSLAKETGKTKTALILEALQEKYRLKSDRAGLVREMAGWMSEEESEELRHAMKEFDVVDGTDWP